MTQRPPGDRNGRPSADPVDEPVDESRRTADVGLALDLGMRLGISVILGIGAGLLLDGWLHTSPVFTLIGVVLGMAAAMYTIWDVARNAMRR